MNVIERSENNSKSIFFKDVSGGLRQLLIETDYAADSPDVFWTVGKKLRIRVACAQLAATATEHDISDSVIHSWIASVEADIFADVRRVLHR